MELVRKHLIRIAIGLLLVLVFLGNATGKVPLAFISQLEAFAYDIRLRLTMPVKGDPAGKEDPRIVIVDIDEKSLAAEGHWPWKRSRIAAMMDRLFDDYHVQLVGFDVVFAERDESSGLRTLQQLAAGPLQGDGQYQAMLKELSPQLDYDRLFADKIRGRKVVLGFYLSGQGAQPRDKGENVGVLPDPVLPGGIFQGRSVKPQPFSGYGANLPELMAAASGAGHFVPAIDPDGIVRRVPMLAEFQGGYYEPLSLAVVRVLKGAAAVKPVFIDESPFSRLYQRIEWLEVGGTRIPVDADVSALIPYRGTRGSFRYVSAADVLAGKAPAEVLRDRIVLVGTTAPGLQDLRSTPMEPVYPGVEIHANLIAGILDGKIKQSPAYLLGAEFLLVLVLGSGLALVLPLLTPLRATVLTAAILIGLGALNVTLWQWGEISMPVAGDLLMVTLLFALNMSYGYFVELRAKRQITGRFGQYVPPQLVEEMSLHPEAFSMAGDSREMTVLFADVRGFTTISEGMDPRELSKLMNEFLTPLTQVIHRHRGTIDKYMGDCIMAFWGAPISDAQHARSAVLAGLEMQATMAALEPQFKARGWPQLRIGVGVNTGRMSVGNMGSELRVAYTVMGDAVNLASRLEGLTKHYGVSMIVGEATRTAVSDCVFRELDRVRPKGKKEPGGIYEPVGPAAFVDQAAHSELSLWNQALRLYRNQQWDAAELQLLKLQELYPGRLLYASFLERVAQARRNPPPRDWDGATAFDTK